MTRVLLHIGRAKTGTSSLQYFLFNNPAFLEATGHHYPRIIPEGKINHNICFEDLSEPIPKAKPDSAEALLERLHPSLVNIISAESLQNIAPSRVAEIFGNCDVQVVCYLRHEFEMLVSGHAQAVKALGSVHSIDDYVEARRGQIDYNAFLGSWDAAFKGRIQVVPYDLSQFRGGSIVSDFLRRFVSEPPPEIVIDRSEWRNPSLTRTTLPYVLQINRNPDQFPLPPDITARERNVAFGALSLRYPGRLRLPRRWRDRLGQQFQVNQHLWAPRFLDQPAPFEYATYPASETDPALDQGKIKTLHQEVLGILDTQRSNKEPK